LAEPYKPDAGQFAAQSCAVLAVADGLAQSAVPLLLDAVAEPEALLAHSEPRVQKRSLVVAKQRDSSALAAAEQQVLSLPEPVAAQQERLEAQLADAARQPMPE
jgi:hypothetical protein